MSINDRTVRRHTIDCDACAGFTYLAEMFKFKAYAFLVALLAFIAHFGVYGFYTMLVGSIGQLWAFAGAGVVVSGMLIIAAVGVTMIKSRPSNPEKVSEE